MTDGTQYDGMDYRDEQDVTREWPVAGEDAATSAPLPADAAPVPEPAPESPAEPTEPQIDLTAADPAPAEEKPGRQTDYLILKRHTVLLDDGEGEAVHVWAEVGRHSGAPKGAVLREFVDGLEDPDGAYKAVAASAWKGGLNAERPTGPVFTPLED